MQPTNPATTWAGPTASANFGVLPISASRRRPGEVRQTGLLWQEPGTAHEGIVAEVAPVAWSDRVYSYAVPEALENRVQVGRRVQVPIGRGARSVRGYIVSLDRRKWDSTLRPIESLIDEVSYLTPELMELAREVSEHYGCGLGVTLKAMTPEAAYREAGLKRTRTIALARLPDEILASAKRVSAARRSVLALLAGAEGPLPEAEVLQAAGASKSLLRAMEKDGWTRTVVRCESAPPSPAAIQWVEPSFACTPQQQYAIERIREATNRKAFQAVLVYGVSGSGKTEVYLRAIRDIVVRGEQAILLVPEILLTTQLVQRLSERLGDVQTVHSGLTDAQRSAAWRRIAEGRAQVVVGTRSAVFAPCPKPGLIVVDEEQEPSYKNLQTPRFHTRDVALMRARQLGIPIVLGSATPSIETWHRSRTHPAYAQVSLPHRVQARPLPHVQLIDMEDEFHETGGVSLLSRAMMRLLKETLNRKEQAVMLLNRRGYAHRIVCPRCGTRLTCSHCSAGQVLHLARGVAICHYCRRRIQAPQTCPHLGCGARLVHRGVGTQRIEEALAEAFPSARIQRADRDTMTHRRDYEDLVRDFSERRIDILVGTQMIAKGLDFPFVSFVGVVDADIDGFAADFRAHERLFQLITQAAGRAGRGEAPGTVVVQTSSPELPGLRFAARHDYVSFAAQELRLREESSWPPFSRIARVVLAHEREETCQLEAQVLADRIREVIAAHAEFHPTDVFGPHRCLMSRVRGRYRYELYLRAGGVRKMRGLTRALRESNLLRTRAKSLVLDVDPVDMT